MSYTEQMENAVSAFRALLKEQLDRTEKMKNAAPAVD